jgi:hypothetical protein
MSTPAEWVVRTLIGSGRVPVEGDREVVHAELWHRNSSCLGPDLGRSGTGRNKQADLDVQQE